MSESSSKIEAQLSFFGDHQTAFTNLKMEDKEFSEDEFLKEDEEMMEIKDEQSNDLNSNRNSNLSKFDDKLEAVKQEIGQIKEMNQIKEMSQFKEAGNEIGRLSQLSDLANHQPNQQPNQQSNQQSNQQLSQPSNQQSPIDQPNESGYSADKQRNESEMIAVNASSLLVGKSGQAAEQRSGESKPEPGKPADNQHLISSLNSLMQQSSTQQNNQFSQVSH